MCFLNGRTLSTLFQVNTAGGLESEHVPPFMQSLGTVPSSMTMWENGKNMSSLD